MNKDLMLIERFLASKQNKLPVRYIGEQPVKPDNVAGTGLVWEGKNDIQYVPMEAVAKLLQHPTVWQLAIDDDDKEAALGLEHVSEPEPVTLPPEAGQEIDLNKMTKAELVDFARNEFGLVLNLNTHTKDQLMDKIVEASEARIAEEERRQESLHRSIEDSNAAAAAAAAEAAAEAARAAGTAGDVLTGAASATTEGTSAASATTEGAAE